MIWSFFNFFAGHQCLGRLWSHSPDQRVQLRDRPQDLRQRRQDSLPPHRLQGVSRKRNNNQELFFTSRLNFTIRVGSFQDFEKHRDALKASAKANKGKMIFVFIDSDAESNKQVLEFFGLNIDNAPFKIIYEMEKNAKYVDKESKVDDDSVAKFVNDFFDGKLKKKTT